MLNVLFLSNLRYGGKPSGKKFVKTVKDTTLNPPAELNPNPNILVEHLAVEGIRGCGVALNDWPYNPFARRGTFYGGFDPLRVLKVLLYWRHVDAVVSVGESNIFFLLLLRHVMRFRPKVILREISARGWSKRDRVVDYVVPRVDCVLALTSHQVAWAQRTYALKNPIDNIGFAIDDGFFQPQGALKEDYIFSIGDDAGRDYPTLIAACCGTDLRLKLRSAAPIAIPEAFTDQCEIIGRLSNAAMRAMYDAAAIVVVPLAQVDYPSGITTLYEAMAMGCAVVASDIGSARDVIRDGQNGVLVPPGSSEALRAALLALMADPARRSRLGAAARATIAAEHSYAAYAKRFAASVKATVAR